MNKIDLKKIHKKCYSAKQEVEFIEVPPVTYICYGGRGDPNTSPDFQEAFGVLYGMAYTIKFMCKDEDRDFTVMPLEGQWWTDRAEEFSESAKDKWNWKVMIAVPDYVNEEIFSEARNRLKEKKNPPGLGKATLEVMTDGLSAQFLYFGPYSEEGPYIAAMHRKVEERGYRLRGRHREIYMNSPQRVSPAKLKTIIRHPVAKRMED